MAVNDITGKKYGKLTVLELDRYDSKKETTYWKCKCECGNEIVRSRSYLTSKRANSGVQSCGCYQKECARKNSDKAHEACKNNKFNETHGDRHTNLYSKYHGIKRRCNNKNDKTYENYGGRGIKCLWESYEDFKKDMYDSYTEHVKLHGVKDTTIERINPNGHYCKDNCRWATLDEQRLNKRVTIYVDYEDGSSITLKELSDKLNINYKTLLSRYKRSKYYKTCHIPYNELIKDKDIV